MLTSEHIRAARGLLRWPARELAQRAGVHIATVQRMERCEGPVQGTVESLRKVQQALQAAGVEFLGENGGPGVRLKASPLPVTQR